MNGLGAMVRNRAAVRTAQVLMGLLLAWAALAKLSDLRAFAVQIHNYRLIPVASENLVAMTLPWVELVAALSLVLGVRARAGAILTSLLLAVFTLGVAQAVARGLDFECGCFGTADATRVGWGKIGQNILMLALAGIASLRAVDPVGSRGEAVSSARSLSPEA